MVKGSCQQQYAHKVKSCQSMAARAVQMLQYGNAKPEILEHDQAFSTPLYISCRTISMWCWQCTDQSETCVLKGTVTSSVRRQKGLSCLAETTSPHMSGVDKRHLQAAEDFPTSTSQRMRGPRILPRICCEPRCLLASSIYL